MELSDLDDLGVKPCFEHLGEDDPAPGSEEIRTALAKLKSHKSPGVDGISNEQLRFGSQGLLGPLVDLFSDVWEKEEVPEDWLKGVITVVPKKSNSSICANNR